MTDTVVDTRCPEKRPMEKTDTQPRRRRKRLMVTTSAVGILALTAAFLGYSSRASAVSTAQAATPDSENEDKKKDPATVAVHVVSSVCTTPLASA